MPEIAMNTYEIRKALAKRKEQLIKDLLKDNAVLKIALFKHIQGNCDCNGMPPCALCRSEFENAIQESQKELNIFRSKKMYPYHNRNLQRIKNGEFIRIEESSNADFAFVLVFSTAPFTRPIRHHAAYKYEFLLGEKTNERSE